MRMVQLFRSYVKDYHPHLASKDWKVDKRILSVENVTEDKYIADIPILSNQKLICWVFFYDEKTTDIVYLLQNKNNLQFITIGFFSEGKLIEPRSLM